MKQRGTSFHFGHALQTARVEKGWSREAFAQLYAHALGKEELTVKAIEALERNPMPPVNQKRREVLEFLLGLSAAASATIGSGTLIHPQRLDREEYTQKLNWYWSQHLATSSVHLTEEIQNRINTIHDELPYSSQQDQSVLKHLLYEYHVLIACLFDSQASYAQAIFHLNRATILGEKLQQTELHAAALYRRANSLYAAENLEDALSQYEQAGHVLDAVSDQQSDLRVSIRMKTALVQAKIRQDQRKEILATLKVAERPAHERRYEDPHFLQFNSQRYILDKAAIFNNIGYYALAIEEVSTYGNMTSSSPSSCRSAYAGILQAQAELGQHHYEEATVLATQVLPTLITIGSRTNIERVAMLYHRLKTSPYGGSINVTQLGVDIWNYNPQLVAVPTI